MLFTKLQTYRTNLPIVYVEVNTFFESYTGLKSDDGRIAQSRVFNNIDEVILKQILLNLLSNAIIFISKEKIIFWQKYIKKSSYYCL